MPCVRQDLKIILRGLQMDLSRNIKKNNIKYSTFLHFFSELTAICPHKPKLQ